MWRSIVHKSRQPHLCNDDAMCRCYGLVPLKSLIKVLKVLLQGNDRYQINPCSGKGMILNRHPTRSDYWWECRTHDLVIVSSRPGWAKLSFRRIFASHLCWRMWEKKSVALERKLCQYWCEKARKHMCITDRHDMTLAAEGTLTLYHTIPTFNTSGKESFWKHCWKRRKCW